MVLWFYDLLGHSFLDKMNKPKSPECFSRSGSRHSGPAGRAELYHHAGGGGQVLSREGEDWEKVSKLGQRGRRDAPPGTVTAVPRVLSSLSADSSQPGTGRADLVLSAVVCSHRC